MAAAKGKTAKGKTSGGSKSTFVMTQKKVTKGTVVFEADGDEAPVTQLYVSKNFVDDSVTEITVTLEK